MTTNALALVAPQTVRVSPVAVPALQPNEVRLQTLACGICGSDLRYYVGDNPWSQHTLGRFEPVDWERTILGHEVCARIVETGGEVTNVVVGDIVAVLPSFPCGVCAECRSGMANLCKQVSHLGHGGGWAADYDRSHFPGAMAEQFVYFADSCFPLPSGDTNFDEYALTDMAAVAVHSVKRAAQVRSCSLGAGSRGLVIGCGQVGLTIAQVARARQVQTVGVDRSEIARRIAAAVRIECSADLEAVGDNFDAVWDTVCTPQTITAALGKLAPGGVLVLLAPHEMEFGIPPLLVGGERAVTTSCNFDPPDDFQAAMRLIGERQIDLRPYITRRVALADAPEIFAHLQESRNDEFKVVIVP